jgi:hypothetical protein
MATNATVGHVSIQERIARNKAIDARIEAKLAAERPAIERANTRKTRKLFKQLVRSVEPEHRAGLVEIWNRYSKEEKL